MDKDIQTAAKALFHLLVALEPRFRTLSEWFKDLIATIDKWQLSEGDQGVKRAKEMLNYYWQFLLGETPEHPKFVKSTNGIPDLLLPLHTRVSNWTLEPRLLSAILSIVRITDLWKSDPTDKEVMKSLEIITDSKLPSEAKRTIDNFSDFIDLFLKAYPVHPITKAFRASLKIDDSNIYLYKESKGPNGSLILNAEKDVMSLHGSKLTGSNETLLSAINKLMSEQCKCNTVGNTFHVETRFQEAVINSGKVKKYSETPGKISLIREKSAKLRLVSQPDYFSQLSQQPIGDWLRGILRCFKTDSTFDQEGAIPKIQNWQDHNGFTASYDQSACTDRFPFEAQLQLIRRAFGDILTESLKSVIVDRDWSITLPSGMVRRVRWSVGQPLGMYASWPLMAVAHHFLVLYAHYLSHGKKFPKGNPFERYVICGDDIVIADRATANAYTQICKRLGMKINYSKSHVSGKGTDVPSVTEFTKKFIWKGVLLYPIKANQVLAAIKDVRQAVPLLLDLISLDTWKLKLPHVRRFIKNYFPKENKFLTTLLTIPREFGGFGFRDDRSLRAVMLDGLTHKEIHPYIYYIASKIRKDLANRQSQALPSLEGLHYEKEFFYDHPLVGFHKEQYRKIGQSPLAGGKTPSTIEIASQLIVDGFQGLRFPLFKDNDPTFSWSTKSQDEAVQNATLWYNALKKSRYFPKAMYHPVQPREIHHKGHRIMVSEGLYSFESSRISEEINSMTDSELQEIQLNLIQRIILGKRIDNSRQ